MEAPQPTLGAPVATSRFQVHHTCPQFISGRLVWGNRLAQGDSTCLFAPGRTRQGIHILALLSVSWVTSGESHDLSVPQFLPL